jgi:DNA-directed RNA polymerase specialized sigma24 family protein
MRERKSMTWMTGISRCTVVLALALGTVACGGDADDETAAEEQQQEVAQPQDAGTQPEAAAKTPLTAADFDAYQRGITKEKEILDELVKKAATTTKDEEKMELMMAAMEDQTMDDGARAAGLSLERYKELSQRMGEVLGASSKGVMGSALRKQTLDSEKQIDELAAQGMPAAQIADMRKGNAQMREQMDTQEKNALEQIAPDAREVFQQRAAQLDSLRMTTVGLRMKVAS